MNDIIERLEAANPFPNHTDIERPTRSNDELFAELTRDAASKPNVVELDSRRPPRSVRRRVLTIAAVLATALVITIGAMLTGPGTTDAQAALTRAAQAAAGFDSGRADVQIVSSGVGSQLPLTAESAFTYNGDDYRFIETGDRSDGSDYVFEIRRIGDRVYWSSPGSPGQFVPGSIDDYASYQPLETTFALNPQAAGLDAFSPVLALTENVTQQDSGTTSVFTGSISREALAQLDRSQVPPGLAIVAGASAAGLPSDIAMQATVIDGVLHQLEISIDGESPAGPMTAQITTTLSGLGNTPSIKVPDDNMLLDLEILWTPEDLAAAGASDAYVAQSIADRAIWDELTPRRPRLCIEFGTSMFEGEITPDQTVTLIDELETLADCYRDANEPAAAAVFDREVQNSAKVLELLLALEDVEARRPGLCTEHQFWPSNASQQEVLEVQAAHIACLANAGEARAAAAVENNPINFLDQLPDE